MKRIIKYIRAWRYRHLLKRFFIQGLTKGLDPWQAQRNAQITIALLIEIEGLENWKQIVDYAWQPFDE